MRIWERWVCLPFNNAAVEEFEVAAGAGFDVDHGVVGAFEVVSKKFDVELGKFGPFESVVSGDGAEIGGDFFGAVVLGFGN